MTTTEPCPYCNGTGTRSRVILACRWCDVIANSFAEYEAQGHAFGQTCPAPTRKAYPSHGRGQTTKPPTPPNQPLVATPQQTM